MKTNLEIKRAAREQLQGKWGMAAVATLVYLVVQSIVNIVTGGPMALGYVKYLREVKNGGSDRIETLFDGFNNFVQALVAYILFAVVVFVGTVLFVIPGIIAAIGLSMTFFILAESNDSDAVEALKKSWEMMKGHKMAYFCLMLRFIGWWLLCLVTFGIATFWVAPYVELAAMGFYDEIKGHSHTSHHDSGYLKKD